MRFVENRAAGGLVDAAAFDADETVFHNVQQADAVRAADFVEGEDDVLRAHLLAVEGDGNALFKPDGDIGGLVRRKLRADAHF